MITNDNIRALVAAIPRFLSQYGLEGDATRQLGQPDTIQVVFWPRQQRYAVNIRIERYLAQTVSDFARHLGGQLTNAVAASGFALRLADPQSNAISLDLAMACDILQDMGREDAKPAIDWLGMLARLSDEQLSYLQDHLRRVINEGAKL